MPRPTPSSTTRSSQYATNVASWINTWFLANDTYMNPNPNYAQVVRRPGPTSSIGMHTGVLDLKCMVRVINAVLVLRAGNVPAWTSAIDSGLVAWTKSYIGWLTTNQIALAEVAATECVTLVPSQCPPPVLGRSIVCSTSVCLRP